MADNQIGTDNANSPYAGGGKLDDSKKRDNSDDRESRKFSGSIEIDKLKVKISGSTVLVGSLTLALGGGCFALGSWLVQLAIKHFYK